MAQPFQRPIHILKIEDVLFCLQRQFALPARAAFHAYRFGDRAAARQDFRLPQIGQRGFGIADLAGQQCQPAHPAIAAAALVFDFVSCALQTVQQ